MTYVIAEPCIGTKDTACVEVCPVDCIYKVPGEDLPSLQSFVDIDLEIERGLASRSGAEADLFQRGIHPAAGERMAREQPALHFLYRALDGLSFATDKQAVRAQLVAMRTTPPEALSRLSMPVLCISGEEDVVIPTAAVEAFAALLPKAQLVTLPEAGHSVYFERPLAFNRLLADFLDAVEESGHSRVIAML